MHDLEHLLRVVRDHEMGAVLDTEELTPPRGEMLVGSNDCISTFRAEEILITEGVCDREVDAGVAEAIRRHHRVSN